MFNEITFYRIFVLLTLMLAPIWVTADEVIVETSQGKLLGVTVGKVNVFKGIPYAVPPVGIRRWKTAEATRGWPGIRTAMNFGPECMQPHRSGDTEKSFWYRPDAPMSEDCLYLNVWSAGESKEKRPVMVWIHGGGLLNGSGSLPIYDGTALSRKGVVVVTINYRLGVFGFLAHPELTKESIHNSSGNYGLTDQIQALKWVQKNIAAFGGDPDNVTLFGESAGGFSVVFHLATPLTKGLFHRAIVQSGGGFFPLRGLEERRFVVASAQDIGDAVAKAAGAKSLAGLRRLTAEELLTEADRSTFYVQGVRPNVDGWVLPDQPYRIFKQGRQNDVPVMAGFNQDEHSALPPVLPGDATAYEKDIRARYGDFANDYLTIYPAKHIQDSVYDAKRDGFLGWNMMTLARLTSNVSSDAYLYYFSHIPPGGERKVAGPGGKGERVLGAYHAGEIAYVFLDNKIKGKGIFQKGSGELFGQTDLRLANAMSDYWVAFARTGQPKVEGLPLWKSYSSSKHSYMEFNINATPKENLIPSAVSLWDNIYTSWRDQSLFWSSRDVGYSRNNSGNDD